MSAVFGCQFMSTLKINEVYGPVQQGEGKSLGREVMFVRTSMCGLHCIFCDTPYTWNWVGTSFAHPQKFEKAKETHEMSVQQVLDKLLQTQTRAVVLSGGEPLIQQKSLLELLWALRAKGYWIEVETAGVIAPTNEFISLVDQINCSPKLSNSGNSVAEREKPFALHKLALCDKTNFKFVVSHEDDALEILNLVRKYNMRDIYLMPEGRSKSEIEQHAVIVKQMCALYGFKATTRLHILQHGNKRGV